MASKKKNGTIEEIYPLPSLGKFYGENYPKEVSIRSLTTFEEKMRLGSQGFYQVMCKLLDAVVTSPENFKAEELLVPDFLYLMYKMRVVTYGPNYKVQVKCPNCNHVSTVNINLDELETIFIDENAIEPFTVGPLPRTKDTLECRHLRVKDMIANEQRSNEILKLHPDYDGDPSYLLDLSSRIVTVNGESKIQAELQIYIENLPAMDSNYLRQACAHFSGDLGLNTDCKSICPRCNEEIDFNLPFSSEFFRPTFDF